MQKTHFSLLFLPAGTSIVLLFTFIKIMVEGGCIDDDEYLYCLEEFKLHNGVNIRLPLDELQSRIDLMHKRKSAMITM